MVEITPEIKAQLDEQKKQCIFCKISSGEIPSEIIINEESIVSVLDINPCSKAHVLMYTKEHYPIMPYIPANEFFNLFGAIPQMSKNIKKATYTESITTFIANGAVAGQQSPHFLFHIVSRDMNDKVGSFNIKRKENLDKKVLSELFQLLSNNIPIMLQNHSRRNPSLVPKVRGLDLSELLLYSDEWVYVEMPEDPSVIGHVVVKTKNYSKIEDVPVEVAAHLFFVSSFVATALFESLGAHGTNIIMHSGKNPDNPEGELIVHVIPRFQDDGLDLLPKQLLDKPDLNVMAEKIRSDKIFIPYQLKEARKRIQSNSLSQKTIPNDVKIQIDKAIEQLRRK
jgi:histidine triad (HIT) family protein